MRTIEDVLDAVTPSAVDPPTAEQLTAALDARERRRRRLAAGAAAGIIGMLIAGVGIGVRGDQRVETATIDQTTTPVTDGRNTTATEQTSTSRRVEPVAPWTRRWFLVPPEPTEVRHVSTEHRFWDQAQRAAIPSITVTDDPDTPASAGLAQIYHLDGADINGIGDPDWDYHSITVAGRPGRVGIDPGRQRIAANIAGERGVFVAVAVGVTEDEVIDLALAARLVDGAAHLGDRIPAGFTVVDPPAPGPTDHSSTLGWGSGGRTLRLQMSPATIEEIVLFHRSQGAEAVTVRATEGVLLPQPGLESSPAIVWEQDGYVMLLSSEGEQTSGGERASGGGTPDAVDRLVAVANSLQRVDQTGLIDRFDDPFMRRQAETVQAWLTATPPPPGWDQSPLINTVPLGRLETAVLVRHYLECTWVAEWADAIRTGARGRRTEAEARLAQRAKWPVFIAETAARNEITGGPELPTQAPAEFQRQAERMAVVETPDQLQEFEADHGCGFVAPPG